MLTPCDILKRGGTNVQDTPESGGGDGGAVHNVQMSGTAGWSRFGSLGVGN